jgi:TRAP-type mannitol/chloroaromatic compound transport system substrate-binding protein
MINQIVEVITKLIEVIDRFKISEIEKDQRIESYLRKIEQCLKESIQELESGKVPTDKWKELRVHAKDLSKNIGDAIGEREANDLSNQLVCVLEDPPEINANLKPLKDLVGSIKAHADKISLPKPQKSPISRRTLIYSTLATSSAFAAGWFGRQQTSFLPVKWKMVSVFGENINNLDLILPKVSQNVCDRVKDLTDGHFIIEIDKSKKFDTDQILKSVSDGEIHCGYSGIFYADDKYKALFFGCAIPFGLSPQEQTAWLLYQKNSSSKLTFMQEIYRELGLNIIPFPAGGTGRQMGGWFKKEVKSVADFKDLTIRIPGLGAEVLDRYFDARIDKRLSRGSIPINQIRDALTDGTLDAAEWNGPYDDMELGLHHAAKYYYYPGWWEPSSTLDIQVNSHTWAKLPKYYQEIFKAVCQETYAKTIAEYDRKNSEALQEILELEKSGKIKMLRFSNEIYQTAKEETENLLKFYASKDQIFDEVYKEWKQFKVRIQAWSDLNELV